MSGSDNAKINTQKGGTNMAKAKKNDDAVVIITKGKIQYFGYGTGKFGSSEKSQVSFIPTENVKELRNQLSELYMNAGIDEKWLPEFVSKDKDRINLSSDFDIHVLAYDGEKKIETNLREFCDQFRTPLKGTPITVRMKFKNGSLYPVAVKFDEDLKDIETYSLENLFE